MAGRPPRRGRLSRAAEFDKVLRNGRSHAGREFVLYVFPRGGNEAPRLGLSVSRKVGGAVERNRVKRVLREAFTLEARRLAPGSDLVVIARADARRLAEEQGLSGVRRALSKLLDKVPGVAPAGESAAGESAAGDSGAGTAGAQAPDLEPIEEPSA